MTNLFRFIFLSYYFYICLFIQLFPVVMPEILKINLQLKVKCDLKIVDARVEQPAGLCI